MRQTGFLKKSRQVLYNYNRAESCSKLEIIIRFHYIRTNSIARIQDMLTELQHLEDGYDTLIERLPMF